MNFLRSFRAFFQKEKLDTEMTEEMGHHVDLQTELNVKAGLGDEDARYAALRQFGNVASIQEQARDGRGWVWLEQFGQDIRYALRSLRKSPGIAAIAILSIALGIGVSTAVFSILNDRLFQSLAVKDPDGLVLFQWALGKHGTWPRMLVGGFGGEEEPVTGRWTGFLFSRPAFEKFREEHAVLADVCAVTGLWTTTVSIDNQAGFIGEGQLVSGDFYRVVGVSALKGRTLLPKDDEPGAEPVCVISDHYWRSRFKGDLSAIGKVIFVNRVATTIVGVTPSDFKGVMMVGQGTDITLPLSVASRISRDGESMAKRECWWLRMMGRLKPGVTREQARAGLEGTFQETARSDLLNQNDLPRLLVASGGNSQTEGNLRLDLKRLMPLLGMAGLLLLAACANVSTLLLARGANRRREIAVRLALGAGRGRIVRQLLTESLLLALSGAVLGLIFSRWGDELFGLLYPASGVEASVPWAKVASLKSNLVLLGFTTALAILVGLSVGLAPALRATRLDLSAQFQGGSHTLGGGALSRFSQVLVVVQVAVSLLLCVVAGLFGRTVHTAQTTDLGFERQRLLLFGVDAQSAGYKPEQYFRLYENIAERIGGLSGVHSVSYAGWQVLTENEGGPYQSYVSVPGSLEVHPNIFWNRVGRDYFETYQIPLLSGRSFVPNDDRVDPKIAIVNQALAKECFGEANPIGRHIMMEGDREIVGVVRDAKQTVTDLRGSTVSPMVYIPFAQSSQGNTRFVVRVESDPKAVVSAIRQTVSGLDQNLPIIGVITQETRIEWLFLLERIYGGIAGFVGLLALGLASVGLYGLMSFVVLRRTSEIGVRMALGAQSRQVLWMILRDSLSIVVVGLIVGLGASAIITQVFWSMFLGVSPTDPLTYACAALLLVVVATIACLIPANRAAKVDPLVALRAE